MSPHWTKLKPEQVDQNVDRVLSPLEHERHSECMQRAKILSTASDFYVKAAEAIESGEAEDVRYLHIKSAKDLIEEAFPEVFEVKRPSQKYLIKEASEYKAIKLIALVVIVLGICYSFVVFGPTGDLSKTWTTDDVAKSTAYPKQPN